MVLNCKVTIGNLVFTAITNIEIVSTWQKFTDTANIKIPRELYFRENGKIKRLSKPIKDVIKPNDEVKIELGYNRQLVTEFEGYVAYTPKATIPYLIECEDEMFQLKQKEVSIHIEDATLRQILEKAAPGYEIDCPDEVYGDFSMASVTPVEIFNELKNRAGIYTFFRGKRLVASMMYSDPKLSEIVANFKRGVNIIDSNIEHVRPEDVRVKIYYASKQKNGSILRESIGEVGGNIIRKTIGFGLSKKQLKKWLNTTYESIKSTGGITGDFRSFGFPKVVHGQTIRYVDDIYEETDSLHYVDEIIVRFSPNGGYKRIIKPSKRR